MPRRSNRRVLVAPLVAISVLVLGACGGGGGSGATKTASNGTIDVTAGPNIQFDVKTINASPGKLTVNLHEKGSLPHTFSVPTKSFEIKVDPSKTNASGTMVLTPGSYEFLCTIPGHAAQMHGTIEVK